GGEFGDLRGHFTALPYQIAAWTKLPSDTWDGNLNAVIVVTLVVILGINGVGIYLRNRYEKKTR
ncbi:MAG TPA: hypothetical protein VK507_12435, partial [Iamia sp.]|nr:hypothetical protein [Iamia sp.]